VEIEIDETAKDVARRTHCAGEPDAQPESEVERASSAVRPRKRKKSKKNRDFQDEIQPYVSEKIQENDPVKIIDCRCEDSRFPVSARCVTISHPDSLSNSETIRS
jgi:hypothetical protein